MKGERIGWFRLAARLGSPVGELQQRMTSREFSDWMHFFEIESNFFHREDYFLAQIAAEVRRGYVQNPNGVVLKPFLLKFESEQEKKQNLNNSKAHWLGLAGIPMPKEPEEGSDVS